MPELPDVQIFKKYFDATSLNRQIKAVVKCDADLLSGVSRTKLLHRLSGKSFSETSRHGKYLFARFGKKDILVLHFGMTGFLRTYKNEEKAPGHIGLLLRFTDGYNLAYDSRRRLGHISLTDNPEHFIEDKGLGPDALALCADPARFAKRLRGHRGSIKTLLMNQKVLAGIGNIYADEILFHAGLHPKKKPGDLDESVRRTLAVKSRHVLETAIDRKAGAEGWPSGWLLPRRQPGRSCPRCSGEIQRISVSGRGTYFCPGHQS
jgi:formamidopyrimidine-DNA glycosylase